MEAKSLVQYVETRVEEMLDKKKDTFLTKEDKVELIRTIYIVGLSQFVAIIVSILAIFNFMK